MGEARTPHLCLGLGGKRAGETGPEHGSLRVECCPGVFSRLTTSTVIIGTGKKQ